MIEKKYYMVVVECGHVGCGKSIEITRYFQDSDIIHAYLAARWMPRSKKKESSVKEVRHITLQDYLTGKREEERNYYLNTYSSA